MKTKQLLTIGLALLTLLANGAFAVEKVEKKKPIDPPKKVTEPAKPTPPAKPASPNSPSKKPTPPKKKYDDFIDKNKNGVDDRKEKPGK